MVEFMINIFLDTNILIKTGTTDNPFYKKLKILNDANLVEVYIHNYVIEEYKTQVYLQCMIIKEEIEKTNKKITIVKRKFGIELKEQTNSEEDIKKIAEKNINDFVVKFGFKVLQVSHDSFHSTFKDYFSICNAFEHAIYAYDKERKKIKIKIVDSIIAHSYLKNLSEENVLITQNIKDFDWIKKKSDKLKLYESLENYFGCEGDSYIEKINKDLSEPSLQELLDNIDFKNKLKKLISEMLVGIERIEINSENFKYCISEVEYSIYDEINFETIKLFEPIIEKDDDAFNVTISFSFTLVDKVNYVASVGDLIENNVINFNYSNISITHMYSDHIDICNYDGEDVIELAHEAELEIFGFFSAKIVITHDLKEIDKVIEYLKDKGKIQIQYDKCSGDPF